MAASDAPSKKEYRTYSFNDRLQAVEPSSEGLTSTEIGRELGVDSSLVRGWLRRYRDEGIDGLKSRRKAYDLYSGGASMSSAARSAGCTYASFRRWVARNTSMEY